MPYADWTEESVIEGYRKMAKINLEISEEFTPLEEEAENNNLEPLKLK